LSQRLQAMKTVQQKGYLIGLHFDPMLDIAEWETEYPKLVMQIFQIVNSKRVAWISIGSLRFPPEMKEKVIAKFPESKIMYGELVRGMDGKMRYLKPYRIAMYKILYDALQTIDTDLFVYFCMEPAEIWERIMGWSPKSNEHLDYLFAKSLHKRFPGLLQNPPEQIYYNTGAPLHKTKDD